MVNEMVLCFGACKEFCNQKEDFVKKNLGNYIWPRQNEKQLPLFKIITMENNNISPNCGNPNCTCEDCTCENCGSENCGC